MTFGAVNPLETTARYTDVLTVKGRLGIPAADVTKDAAILAAIIGGEYALDVHFGRSFPDPGTDSFSGPYLYTAAAGAPAAGEITLPAATTLDVNKVDAEATDHTAAVLPSEPVVIISRSGVELAQLAGSAINDQGASWQIPFELTAGELPTAAANVVFELVGNDGFGVGPVRGIPGSVSQAALGIAIAVYKSPDAPQGVAGSDEFFGAIDVADIARRAISRDPSLVGFMVPQGFGVA